MLETCKRSSEISFSKYLREEKKDVKKKMDCIKYLLVLLTSILMLLSFSLIAVITAIKIKYSDLETITGSPPIDITIIVIAVVLCLVSVIGVCGAVTRRPRLLKAFIFFVILLICIEIGIIVVVFTQQEKIKIFLRKLWDNMNDKSRVTFQKVFSCCDTEGNKTTHASRNDPSCFENGIAGERKKGCDKALQEKWGENQILIVGATCGLMFAEIMVVVISCLLIYDDKEGSRTLRKTRVVPIRINVDARRQNEYSSNVPDVSPHQKQKQR